jgi:hypothetical protein
VHNINTGPQRGRKQLLGIEEKGHRLERYRVEGLSDFIDKGRVVLPEAKWLIGKESISVRGDQRLTNFGGLMANMGRFCKAYPISRLRQYSEWTENLQNLRKETNQINGEDVVTTRELQKDDFFYLQENLVVTDGIFIDENIIFDSITPKWKEYCMRELNFEIPLI